MIAALLCLTTRLVSSGPADELDSALHSLSLSSARERDEAERWLRAHLASEHYPRLAEAALAGDPEVRLRIARAVGGDERHLDLALFFAGEKNEALRALGEEALHDCVARFGERTGEPGLGGAELEPALAELARGTEARYLRLDPRLSLEELCERIDLHGQLPLGLTVDPSIATRRSRKPEAELLGPWNQVLVRLARGAGVTLELHGLGASASEEAPGVDQGFLRFTLETDVARRTGVDIVSDWLRTLAAKTDVEARARAARNLAASGFPAALRWMEELYRKDQDPAALEGLLRAAARGRVSGVLVEPPTLRTLVARVGADLDLNSPEGRARSARTLAGLVHVGCFGPGGERLLEGVLDGFDGSSARSRWARLLLCERLGCVDQPALERARATLGDAAQPAALRLQALRTFVALSQAQAHEPPRCAEPLGLFATAGTAEEADTLGRSWHLAGLEPPARDPASLPGAFPFPARAALLSAWLWQGDEGAEVAALLGLLASGPADVYARGEFLERCLAPWVRRGEGPRVARLLDAARERAPARGAELDRLALLLGLLPAPRVGEFLSAAAKNPLGPRPDLVLLGALGGYRYPLPTAEAARSMLLETLDQALHENRDPTEPTLAVPLMAVLERAIQGLYSAGRDQEAAEFTRVVRQRLLRNPKSPLPGAIDRGWPSPPGIERLDLDREALELEAPPSL